MTDSHADPAIAAQLVAAFKADPDRKFNDEEANCLAAAAEFRRFPAPKK